jgi:hypothetical protein
MACQAASATTSLIDALKAGPLCLQRTLGPEKISTTTLNATRPGCGTPLIWYLGVEVLPKCPSRERSLSVGIGASAPKDSLSSTSLYSFSPSLSLRGEYSFVLHLHCQCHGPPPAATPQQVCLDLRGYPVPLAQSQKVPPPEMHVAVSCDEAPTSVACSEVPTDQWADGRCSYGR